MAAIIDGKKIAAEVRAEIREETAAFCAEHGYAPGLTVITSNAAKHLFQQMPAFHQHQLAAFLNQFFELCLTFFTVRHHHHKIVNTGRFQHFHFFDPFLLAIGNGIIHRQKEKLHL